MKRFGKRQKGFTLIELLVVVGIMAALAAIIVPNVARFVGTGKSEGAKAEGDAIQAAMDAAIADNGLLTVPAVGVGSEVIDFSDAATLNTPYSPGVYARDPDGAGSLVAGDDIYLYPQYLRIAVAKYGSDGVSGVDQTGYTWSDTGEVDLP